MNGDLRPYPEYRDSALPWLRKVPNDWNILRCKYLFHEVDERSTTGEETHLSMSQQYGLVPSKGLEGKRLYSESYVGGKLCRPSDLVLNRLKAHLGVFARAKEAGVVSPDYTVLRPKYPADVGFFEHVFKTPSCIAELRKSTKGIVEGFWRLYTDDFYNIRIPVPPAAERSAILRFVVAHDAQVRKFIRNRRRLIDVLNEQKQAIVNRAVTRGIDSTVKYKPSGVDWIGDIPEPWRIDRLKYLARFDNGIAFKPNDWKDSGVPIIRIQNLNGADGFNYTDRTDLPADLLIQPGELLFAWSGNRGTSFGSFIWDREFPAYLNQHIFKVADSNIHRGFFYYALRAVTAHVEEQAHGIIGLVHITKPELGAIRIPVPPDDEQTAIASYLDGALVNTNKVIACVRREIDLIREYRTRLIADVVTGKLDVRHLAPQLDSLDADELPALNKDENFDDDLLQEDDAEFTEESVDSDE